MYGMGPSLIISFVTHLPDPGHSGSQQQGPKCVPSAPPPAYSEIDTSQWKPPPVTSGDSRGIEDEPGPPGYDVVMRQQSEASEGHSKGPVVQRKKSLTNHNV